MILRKIKQILGMGSGSEKSGRSGQDVVVQEERSAADTDAAVGGIDESDEDVGSGDVDEPVAAGTDAGASTESLVDDGEASEQPESRAEPAEAAGPGAADESTTVEEADTEAADVDAEAAGGTDVDEIKGIGPAYSDRLGEVEIHTVAELAAADAADIAERTTLSETTVQKWIDRAQEFET